VRREVKQEWPQHKNEGLLSVGKRHYFFAIFSPHTPWRPYIRPPCAFSSSAPAPSVNATCVCCRASTGAPRSSFVSHTRSGAPKSRCATQRALLRPHAVHAHTRHVEVGPGDSPRRRVREPPPKHHLHHGRLPRVQTHRARRCTAPTILDALQRPRLGGGWQRCVGAGGQRNRQLRRVHGVVVVAHFGK